VLLGIQLHPKTSDTLVATAWHVAIRSRCDICFCNQFFCFLVNNSKLV